MESRLRQGRRSSVSSKQFRVLLDQLVAVQMDLEPICGLRSAKVPVVLARDVIATACDVLHSAIADVRNIIYQADVLMDLPQDAAKGLPDGFHIPKSSHDAP
jgi:hypothetical protein